MKNFIRIFFSKWDNHPYGRVILVPFKRCLFQFPLYMILMIKNSNSAKNASLFDVLPYLYTGEKLLNIHHHSQASWPKA